MTLLHAALALTIYMALMILWDGWSTVYGMKHGTNETNKKLIALKKWIEKRPWGGPWLWLALAKGLNIVILLAGWAAWHYQWLPINLWVICLGLQAAIYTYIVGYGNYRAIQERK